MTHRSGSFRYADDAAFLMDFTDSAGLSWRPANTIRGFEVRC
jgi:hypothetical protein